MNALLKILVSLSLSGALLILILLLCKPFIKDKLSKRWQYYIWLIAIVRLLLPFSPETSLMGTLFQHFDTAIMQTGAGTQPEQDTALLPETDSANYNNAPDKQGGTSDDSHLWLRKLSVQNIGSLCLLIWFIVVVGLLIKKVTIYQSFLKYIMAGRVEISDMALWERVGKLLEKAHVNRPVGLYTNSLISSPLLIGFFHPCIMLPTAKLSDSDFQYTILHELTHYKRRDMFYKWLVQVTICFHWFNPMVYLMSREVGRTCELSCDEAVIRKLDREERRAYGDTLINAMGYKGKYKDSLSTITLSESNERLKERLGAIMKFHYPSKITRLFTVFLTVAVCLLSTFTGSYALASPSSSSQNSIMQMAVNSNGSGSSSYKAGSSILFGKYKNQSIKWKILSINSKNEALLFAADILPSTWLPFDKKSNSWDTSSIRAWLNGTQKGEFLSSDNFTQSNRDAIIRTNVSSGILGKATNDFVYLISKKEYQQYNVGNVSSNVNSYWSRTGEANTKGKGYPGNVALLSSDHQVGGSYNASENGGVRPMMRVDLSDLSKNSNNKKQTDATNRESTPTKSNHNASTISVNIQKTDKLISATHGRRYKVYGPFNGSKGDTVSCTLNNNIESRLEIIVSGQGKSTENVIMSNTAKYGKSFTATLSIGKDILNKNQQFYVFIGSDNIDKLTGTISLSKH